jgi:hypothetical protein
MATKSLTPLTDLISRDFKGQLDVECRSSGTLAQASRRLSSIEPGILFQRSDLAEGTASLGGNTVQTTIRPSPFTPPISAALKPFMALAAAGATIIHWPTPISVNSWNAAFTASGNAENAQLVSGISGSLSLTAPGQAKQISVQLAPSRQLLVQAQYGAVETERAITQECLRAIGPKWDHDVIALILASPINTAGQLDNAKLNNGSQSFAAASASYANLISARKSLLKSNVSPVANFAWLLNSDNAAVWQGTQVATNYPRFLIERDGEEGNIIDFLGHRVITSENVGTAGLFGKFDEVLICIHSVDIVSDHVTLASAGRVLLTLTLSYSAGILRAPSILITN